MERTVAFTAGVLSLALALPAVAQEFKPATNLFAQKKTTPKPPTVDWSWRPSTESASTSEPTVVCGMTLVPADPKLDPKIRVEAPQRGVDFTLRVVPPTVCRPR